MRDLHDAQAWADHHDQFSQWVGSVIAAAGAPLGRTARTARSVPGQLLAGLLALSITLVTFAGSLA